MTKSHPNRFQSLIRLFRSQRNNGSELLRNAAETSTSQMAVATVLAPDALTPEIANEIANSASSSDPLDRVNSISASDSMTIGDRIVQDSSMDPTSQQESSARLYDSVGSRVDSTNVSNASPEDSLQPDGDRQNEITDEIAEQTKETGDYPDAMAASEHPDISAHVAEFSEPGGALQLAGFEVTDASDIRPVWRWPMLWLGLLLVFTNVGAAAFLWIRHIPKPADCQQASIFASDRDRLVCANKLAQSGRLQDLLIAIDAVSSWSTDHPLYPETQRLIGQWSRSIMNRARTHLYRNDLTKAVMIARQVPPTSPIYPEVQSTIEVWKMDWDKGYDRYKQALAAIKAKQWGKADLITRNYQDIANDYWRLRLSSTLQQLSLDEVDWNRLQVARVLATSGDPRRLINAITTAQQISPTGHIWAEAKDNIDQWGAQLLKVAIAQLQANNYAAAMGMAEAIPDNSQSATEAQQLLLIARSLETLDSKRVKTGDLSTKIWEYGVTLELARHVQPEQALYKIIKDKVPDLEQQFQDLLTLQSAQLTGTIQHPVALRLAANQAKQIEPERPLRSTAQAKIARWNNEVLSIQARPYLGVASRLAAEGTPKSVAAAIAKLSKIPPNHPLYGKAQALISQYKVRLEVLKDNAILEEAKTLARSQKFDQAIARLNQIQPDRPLYSDAQILYQDVMTQLQITEDKPILDQATALAKKRNYTEAITLAEQISPERALYFEAQDLIGRWLVERDGAVSESEAPLF